MTDVVKSILVFDPGENTGWVCERTYSNGAVVLEGGTVIRNVMGFPELFDKYKPTHVVFESFHLYPYMRDTLTWSSFYPCEIIGIIRYLCESRYIPYVEQSPSIKKFAGGLDDTWVEFRKRSNTTEHTKDAFLHLKYYHRNNENKPKKHKTYN